MRPAVALLLWAGTVLTGCFSERLAPPTFRYRCETEAECVEGESCLDGLCQVPCTQATFASDCPAAGNYAACLNGVCSSLCTLDAEDDVCPEVQSCIELPFEISSGGGGFGGGGNTQALGLCGIECTEGDDRCPEGESCFEGFCVAACETQEQCGDGFSCTMGFCVPG